MKARRILILTSLLLSALAILAHFIIPPYMDGQINTLIAHEDYTLSPEAQKLHKTLIIGDLHADTAFWQRNLLNRNDRGHLDLPRMREGNMAVQMFTVFTKVPDGLNYEKNSSDAKDRLTPLIVIQAWPIASWTSLTERALYQAGKMQQLAENNPEQFKLILNSNDLQSLLTRRAEGDDIVGGILGTEGSHALDGKLANIDRLYDAGFRMMSLQHFFDNKLGGSLHGESQQGLSEFGRSVVVKLLEKNIMIDVSHSSVQVVEDVMDITQKPLIVSHTGLKGNCDTARNLSDSLMKKIAQAGGLIGIGFWDAAVCDASPEGIVKAMRYGIDLLGVDHIALGSDYDGAIAAPFDVSELAVLTDEMLKANFSEIEIRKVMGGNMMRYLKENLPKY